MSLNGSIVKFVDVSFGYGENKPILVEANFTLRQGSKMTLMGQNGAGKSTIFQLIMGVIEPDEGKINVNHGLTIATARQVIPRDDMDLTVVDFFQNQFKDTIYDIEPKIDEILEVVNLHAPHDKLIKDFSGGQQARLLLASALIQDPDLLLLDEPTNNLDSDGIEHLTQFLKDYEKTCIVISHDADFLNAFTHGVLYLDVHVKNIEQYDGNYSDVVKEIVARVEKEERKNAQMEKKIQDNKDKANFFAHKGGRMRALAKKMREEAVELEENKVDVRKEDQTIRRFEIPFQDDTGGVLFKLNSYSLMKDHKIVTRKANVELRKDTHLQIVGPNGIGKTTLLESIVDGTSPGSEISPGVRVGYYRQDFSTLNFDHTVYKALEEVMKKKDEHTLRSVAAGFLITKDVINSKIGSLSEGQKGLVAFAQLVLLKPGLLILDEPTNHINFRHIPVIARALDQYKGALIMVSHVPEFASQIRIDETLALEV